ncbi:hypothetical protein EJ06DRAFT_533278 [Trichodelitschia bisporula]|uniref:Uncharacterized protein n=1 Tax=Trichodelitschia bisporula TaxID=703511 RepID=A0A6G1HML6_9PEZI|nr:hypothetical protein EJ06DRAFT_533278 [Trichodelitschia bisporula]
MSAPDAPRGHIVSLPRLTSDPPILAQILPSDVSKSKSPLNLQIIATDGALVFSATLTPALLPSLRAPSFTGPETDIETALRRTLLDETFGDGNTDSVEHALKGLELVVPHVDDDNLQLAWRLNDGKSVTPLATLPLEASSDTEIDPLAWLYLSTTRTQTLLTRLRETEALLATRNRALNAIKTELSTFVERKKAHDAKLLDGFAKVVNSKKVKVRELTRVLGGVKMEGGIGGGRVGGGATAGDPGEAAKEATPDDDDTDADAQTTASDRDAESAEPSASPSPPRSAKATRTKPPTRAAKAAKATKPLAKSTRTTRATRASRGTKRASVPSDSESDSDDAFEALPSKSAKGKEKGDEPMPDAEPELPPPRKLPFGKIGGKGRGTARGASAAPEPVLKTEPLSTGKKAPPARKAAPAKKATPPSVDEDSEMTDDEL